MSYKELSEKSNITLKTINKIVKGSTKLNIQTIAKLEKGLDYKFFNI